MEGPPGGRCPAGAAGRAGMGWLRRPPWAAASRGAVAGIVPGVLGFPLGAGVGAGRVEAFGHRCSPAAPPRGRVPSGERGVFGPALGPCLAPSAPSCHNFLRARAQPLAAPGRWGPARPAAPVPLRRPGAQPGRRLCPLLPAGTPPSPLPPGVPSGEAGRGSSSNTLPLRGVPRRRTGRR